LCCKNTAFSFTALFPAAQPPGQRYSHDGTQQNGQPVVGGFGGGLQDGVGDAMGHGAKVAVGV